MADRTVQPKIYNGSSSDNLIIKQAENAKNLTIVENGLNVNVPLKDVSNLSVNDRFIESRTLLRSDPQNSMITLTDSSKYHIFNFTETDIGNIQNYENKIISIGFKHTSSSATFNATTEYKEFKIKDSKINTLLEIYLNNNNVTYLRANILFNFQSKVLQINMEISSVGNPDSMEVQIGEIYLIN